MIIITSIFLIVLYFYKAIDSKRKRYKGAEELSWANAVGELVNEVSFERSIVIMHNKLNNLS